MEFCHTDIFLHSGAAQQLAEFIQKRREKWSEQTGLSSMGNFESFEQDLHALVMAFECEMVSEELGRYDVTVEEIEMGSKVYRRGESLPETYLTAAGRVSVERHLYYPGAEKGKGICPLELRCGIIGGYFTPRAARQGAFAMAHLTPGESEALFAEIGNMQPSRSSLDRLAKALSPHWESHRVEWEAQLRQKETVSAAAKVMAISVDGVMAPIRGADKQEKAEQPGKHASGPTGYKEVGCGTVTLYDQEAERLQTVRYARMPESKKVTLQQQLETEVSSILALSPDLVRVHLADGAKDNWRLMKDIESHLPAPLQAPIEIVDFYHGCDHLKNGCDAAWGESTHESKDYFERLKTWLKESEDGTERIIRTLRFQCSLAKGNKRKRLEAELTYFRNQQQRMHYAEYIRQNLPIASGVMEASCKTLVTQRLKRSGMTWTKTGGQAILTLRSLIQSYRWRSAWALWSADFCQVVKVRNEPNQFKTRTIRLGNTQGMTLSSTVQPSGTTDYAALPLVG
ncbi:MAG TPA: hypothetical protein VGA03_00540 [Anaerolineales bacterium]